MKQARQKISEEPAAEEKLVLEVVELNKNGRAYEDRAPGTRLFLECSDELQCRRQTFELIRVQGGFKSVMDSGPTLDIWSDEADSTLILVEGIGHKYGNWSFGCRLNAEAARLVAKTSIAIESSARRMLRHRETDLIDIVSLVTDRA